MDCSTASVINATIPTMSQRFQVTRRRGKEAVVGDGMVRYRTFFSEEGENPIFSFSRIADRCVRCGAGEETGDFVDGRRGERGVEMLCLGDTDGEANGDIMLPSLLIVGVRGILTWTEGNPNSK